MKTIFISFITVCLATNITYAQVDTNKTNKLGDFDEVIIKKKGSNNKISLNIEISDDNVKVNGKPLEQFLSDDLSIKIKKRTVNGGRKIIIGNDEEVIIEPNENPVINKSIKKAMLGVTTENDAKGAVIEEVSENSAADKAGLKVGDIITKVNNIVVKGTDDLKAAIATFKPNDEVTITYLRAGKVESKKIVLGTNKTVVAEIITKNSPFGLGFNMDKMPKMDLKDLNMDGIFKQFEGGEDGGMFKMFGFDGNSNNKIKIGISATDVGGDKGININDVKKDSPADKAGLKVGDVITEIAEEPIFNTTDLKKALKNIEENKATKIKYTRNNKSLETNVLITKPIKTVDF